MKRQHKSKIMAAIHETVGDLHKAQVMSAQALRRFDVLCLTPVQERLEAPKPLDEIRSGTLSA